MRKSLVISVHQLVDLLLRTGDIDNRIYNQDTMREGTRLHAYHQARAGTNYLAEYFLRDSFIIDDFLITLFGRADGIVLGETVMIDEIKTTVSDLEAYADEQRRWHLGQAECYACLYVRTHALPGASVRLTYIDQLDGRIMRRTEYFTKDRLEEDITALLREYLTFYQIILTRREKRNASAEHLVFPFPTFRKGQRELARYAYGIARSGGLFFVEAPTGIGKTISTLFPFIKSFADGLNETIFYLTAKGSGKEAAAHAIRQLKDAGLKAASIIITAKDKICLAKGKGCNPDECPYAKGYYTRLKDVLLSSIQTEDDFTPATILALARLNGMCPFELSLDLALFCDVIIGDYNYFFDPRVALKRFLEEDHQDTLILVDEAHNLVERGRSMYSASFTKSAFKRAGHCYRKFPDKKIRNASRRVNAFFNSLKTLPLGETTLDVFPMKAEKALEAWLIAASSLSKNHHDIVDEDFLTFFFTLHAFMNLLELFDDTFALYVTRQPDDDISVDLLSLDPSSHLRRSLMKVKGGIVFSATLSPSKYYLKMIGGREDDAFLRLPSPFPRDNLLLLVAPTVSIRYRSRLKTYETVASYLKTFIAGRVGNYLIYVPSYEYLTALLEVLTLPSDVSLLVQTKDMTEEEQQAFLASFVMEPPVTTVGLVVIGGAFGEGIDLSDERLIGVAIIGVGLPQIGFARNLIRAYYEKDGRNEGYRYAYVCPGMNRILQAAGRLIRSESDRGAALLIDDRYLSEEYRLLFLDRWRDYHVITKESDIREALKTFWSAKPR